MSAVGTAIRVPGYVAAMPPARRRIYEAGIRAGVRDPEAKGRPAWADLEQQREQEGDRQEREARAAREAEERRAAEERRRLTEAAARAAREAEASAGAVTPAEKARRIIAEVAAAHGLTSFDLVGEGRARPIVFARHEAMYRVAAETGLSLGSIGHKFGGRDHSTVWHSVRVHARRNGLALPGSVKP